VNDGGTAWMIGDRHELRGSRMIRLTVPHHNHFALSDGVCAYRGQVTSNDSVAVVQGTMTGVAATACPTHGYYLTMNVDSRVPSWKLETSIGHVL